MSSTAAYTLLGPSRGRAPYLKILLISLAIFTVFSGITYTAHKASNGSATDAAAKIFKSIPHLFGSEGEMGGRKASWGALRAEGQKDSVKTNLRPDKGYLLSWGGEAGWTNVVFTQLKHIHIAKLANRIPIMPPTMPNSFHLGAEQAPPILLSDIFDLPRLSRLIDLPIVEMEELKGPSFKMDKSLELDVEEMSAVEFEVTPGGDMKRDEDGGPPWETMGCWSLSMGGRNVSEGVRYMQAGRLRLEPFPMPFSTIDPHHPIPNGHALVGHLGDVLRFDGPSNEFQPPLQDILEDKTGELTQIMEWHPDYKLGETRPETGMACIDGYVYFTMPKVKLEVPQWLDREDYPTNSWTRVGTHMHWRKDVKALAMAYLKKGFGLSQEAEMPSYVSMHIRRTDQLWPCQKGDGSLDEECLGAGIFNKALQAVKAKLRSKGVEIGDHVVFTTDDRDAKYRKTLTDMGWVEIDHERERTVENLGLWWPTILDSVFISSAVGFVGTAGSTMSEVAVRRVEDWQSGIAIQVSPWDRPKSKEYII